MKGGPGAVFRPIRSRRTSDAAVEQIVRLIREGHLAPGAKLPPERELVELLGVSRSSLREAIYVLQTMGAVRVVRGHGTYVRDDTSPTLSEDWFRWMFQHHESALEMLEVYEVLEVRMAALAAARRTEADLEALDDLVKQMERAVAEGDYDALVAADACFHDTMRRAGRNQVMARVLKDLDDNVLQVRRVVMALPGKPDRVVAEHRAILDAVRSRDGEAASRLVLEQVGRSRDEVIAVVGDGVVRAVPNAGRAGGASV